MAKSQHNRPATAHTQKSVNKSFIAVDKKAFDPSISSLFATSLGPVTAPPKSRYQSLPEKRAVEESSDEAEGEEVENDAELSEIDSEIESESEAAEGLESEPDLSAQDEQSDDEQSQSDNEAVLARLRESVLIGDQEKANKKRKRDKEADVEDVYMQKLAREEAKDEEKRKKKQKTEAPKEKRDAASDSDSDNEDYTIPKHETQTGSTDKDELDKAARTVFLSNVSSEAITSKSAKKELMRHLGSFLDDLADNKPPHKVESIRFRSTAFASALAKKAAFVNGEVLDATTKSTNAYAVYSTQVAARQAARRLNGTVVLKRHLRVDSVAHPAKVDHRRCVFVGNLGFVDDESKMNPDDEDKKKKSRPPGDTEEGLWVQFGKAGKVESVRVVRDPKTRVGKGFAYVQFEDENAVEAALQFNDQKYPPMLPRKLRVVRAKAPKKKTTSTGPKPKESTSRPKGAYNAKVTEQQKTEEGRARAMLGKAGAFKRAEDFVFEGHRASRKQGTSGLKLGGKKKSGKPQSRSSKRGTAWKASGGGRKAK